MANFVIARLLDLAVEIQQIPAPTFAESRRSAVVYRRFLDEGLEDVQIDEYGNVFARLAGIGKAPPLVVSAHLDTVFAIDTPLEITRQPGRLSGPGIGDNSLAVAALFGLVWSLRAAGHQLPGDIWLVANVREEGLGNSQGMQAVVDRFQGAPCAYIVLEGMALGQIYHRALGSQRFRISAETAGGHSWVDYGRPSAIHELMLLASQILALPIPQSPRTSMNIGTIAGGVSVNTIAGQATMELDLRSEDAPTLETIVARVHDLAERANRVGVVIAVDLIGCRPVGELSQSHPLVQLATRCLLDQGVEPKLNIGSTDANLPLSRGYPAICVGITNGGGGHTPQEFILTDPVERGLAQIVALVQDAFLLPR